MNPIPCMHVYNRRIKTNKSSRTKTVFVLCIFIQLSADGFAVQNPVIALLYDLPISFVL